MIQMPNISFRGPAPPLNPIEKELLENLKSHITQLAKEPQGRNISIINTLSSSMFYIIEQFHSSGYQIALQEYEVDGTTFANIEVELLGREKPEEILLIGAHYDSIPGSPGANDNASGVAGTLEIARLLHGQPLSRTLRLVTFVNEEPPFFQTEAMGSLVYANRSAAKKEKIVGMITLETIGYFSDEPGSQQYPPFFNFSHFYPDRGNFIAFIGNLPSRKLVRESINIFRKYAQIPSEGVSLPTFIPGVDWSDHWSFWKNGYPALMITDTAPYRYPHYHTAQDTPDKIDYEKMTRVILGVQKIVEVLAGKL